MNTYVLFVGGTKSLPKQPKEQNVLEVKGPLSFFLGPLLQVPRMLFAVSHSFDCVPTEMVLAEALSLSEGTAIFFGNMGKGE